MTRYHSKKVSRCLSLTLSMATATQSNTLPESRHLVTTKGAMTQCSFANSLAEHAIQLLMGNIDNKMAHYMRVTSITTFHYLLNLMEKFEKLHNSKT
ncbi:hypothetical protein M5K25_011378 [Dendrobium thyrsiflorum]|uniref:Uncharacterized protein n=1 Tax=Dendrobium thyrsiflorum TaxID=117978 RepID=A0ABD0V2L4_DENTH